MNARRKIKIMSLAIMISMIATANLSYAQDEYDDMYFNAKDRKEVKFNQDVIKANSKSNELNSQVMAKNTSKTDVINPAYSATEYGDLKENYSAKNINPEYIERYKDNPKEASGSQELAEGDAYYDEYYERTEMPGENKKGSERANYSYPSSYYGGYNAMAMNRMYRNPWYDPFYAGGFSPGWSMGLGYTFGYMPGFSMSLGYGTGWGYGGYNPYGFYDPFSPFGNPYYYSSRFYDPFYSPWAYNPYYGSMPYYGYGGPGFYCPYPSYGYGGYSGYNYVTTYYTGTSSSGSGGESNSLIAPSYRQRVSRGSDRIAGDTKDVPNNRRTMATRNANTGTETASNARVANRDFSRSQNEYYNRTGSRNATSTVASRTTTRNNATYTSTRNLDNSSVGSTTQARVRSQRSNTNYSRPSYKSTRQSNISSGSYGRTSSNSGTYRSTRSSGSSSSYRSSGSSYSGSSGASFGSSSSGSRSSGSISSGGGGSRSSGGSSGGGRSGRGN